MFLVCYGYLPAPWVKCLPVVFTNSVLVQWPYVRHYIIICIREYPVKTPSTPESLPIAPIMAPLIQSTQRGLCICSRHGHTPLSSPEEIACKYICCISRV